jgi:hypothetical protein
MNRVKRNLAQIYFDVLKEPINAGNKLQLSPQAINSHQNLFAAPHAYFAQSILPTESRA